MAISLACFHMVSEHHGFCPGVIFLSRSLFLIESLSFLVDLLDHNVYGRGEFSYESVPTTTGRIQQYPLFLQSSDHPGTQIVNLKLNGMNFQKWSRSVKIAPRTKVKLGFIDGSCSKPSRESPKYEQWIKCDSMVVSWLLNSMMPELSEAFLYVNYSQELWDELMERFGESNGPLLYQLEKEISDLYQGNDSVAVYYTKLKKLWDEKSDMSDIPLCTCPETCPSIKKSAALEQR